MQFKIKKVLKMLRGITEYLKVNHGLNRMFEVLSFLTFLQHVKTEINYNETLIFDLCYICR